MKIRLDIEVTETMLKWSEWYLKTVQGIKRPTKAQIKNWLSTQLYCTAVNEEFLIGNDDLNSVMGEAK